MGNFRKKFKSSFRARMMLYFYVLTLIPVLFTSVILYSTALKSVMSMAETSSRQIVDSAAAELNELMHNMASLPSIIRSDVAFQQMLRKEYSDESERVTDCSKGTATLGHAEPLPTGYLRHLCADGQWGCNEIPLF